MSLRIIETAIQNISTVTLNTTSVTLNTTSVTLNTVKGPEECWDCRKPLFCANREILRFAQNDRTERAE